MRTSASRSVMISLVLFLAIAFSITWLLWGAVVLSRQNAMDGPWALLLLLGGYGPTIAGIVLTYHRRGRAGLKWLWSSTFQFRFGAKWYLVILLLIPVLYAGAILVEVLLTGRAPDFSSAEQLVAQPVSILPILLLTLITGPVAEEYGWRGYLNDRLHARFGMFVESLIIGLIWAIWHLPLFYMVGMSSYEITSFWLFVLYHIPLAMLFTWLFVGTGESMMAAILFHFVHNLTLRFMSPDLTYRLLFMVPIALVLSVKWLRANPKQSGAPLREAENETAE